MRQQNGNKRRRAMPCLDHDYAWIRVNYLAPWGELPDQPPFISEAYAADLSHLVDACIGARAAQRTLAAHPLDDRRELVTLGDRLGGFHLENPEPGLGRFQIKVRVEKPR